MDTYFFQCSNCEHEWEEELAFTTSCKCPECGELIYPYARENEFVYTVLDQGR